jgi:hypothetical protein
MYEQWCGDPRSDRNATANRTAQFRYNPRGLPSTNAHEPNGRSEEAAGILLIRLAVFAALLGALTRTFADPDLWGHVRFGGDILREGLASTDPYSFTSDVPWVNHEWLAEVVMYLSWRVGGGFGLISLKLAIISATLALVVATLRKDTLTQTVRDVLVFIALVDLWPRVFVIRPQLFSIVLFAVLMWIFRSAERGRWRPLWLTPAVLALWVNVHGGWIVGLGALLVWSASIVVRLHRCAVPPARAALVAVLTTFATLANPYGIGLWGFLYHTVGLGRPNISDWRPLLESGPDVVIPWMLTAGVACLALWRGGSRVPLVHAAIALGIGLASVRVNRLDIFFTLSTVMLLGPLLAVERAPMQLRPAWTGRAVGLAAVVVIALSAFAWAGRRNAICVRLDGPWMPEREAGTAIVQSRLRGKLLTWFDWGQYAIWHFAPDLKVSLDGRRETVYSDAFVARHLTLYFEPGAAAGLLGQLNPDYAWLPGDLPLVGELTRRGWHRLYTGPQSAILGAQAAGPLDVSRLSSPACFPGP